ncbi:Hypothetical protein GbCGDNIH7_8351 [Granulibacter bethesdensis]|nr:Hypothetical protein GbCGDNIH7_8351 [Granulibacter bethesdensis]
MDRLSPSLKTQLRQLAAPVIRSLARTFMNSCDLRWSSEEAAFLHVNSDTRKAIALLCLEQVMGPVTQVHNLSASAPQIPFWSVTSKLRVIDRSHLSAGLEGAWQDKIPQFLEKGVVFWPSPVDGLPIPSQGSLIFDDFHFAFRFADYKNELVFYVLITRHNSLIGGLWIPATGEVYPCATSHGVAVEMLSNFSATFTLHIIYFAQYLDKYFQNPKKKFASVMRGRPGLHIGHHLWNELSGIEQLIRKSPAHLPEWFVLNSQDGAEIYAPVDSIFPELEGKVNRSFPHWTNMVPAAYEAGYYVMRVTSEFVSEKLRNRIRNCISTLPKPADLASAVERKSQTPIIILGLRVENRTLVDQSGFFLRLVSKVASHFGGGIFVLDGHNAHSGNAEIIESYGERPHDGIKPVDVEKRLIQYIRDHIVDQSIEIYSTIAEPVASSLAWGYAAHCFVSCWGANLAKYRLACNLPGYILTSRWNLTCREDLHIYDDPAFMELPTPVKFVNPEWVYDDPDAPQLIEFKGQESYSNFNLDEETVFADIIAHVEAWMCDASRAQERITLL